MNQLLSEDTSGSINRVELKRLFVLQVNFLELEAKACDLISSSVMDGAVSPTCKAKRLAVSPYGRHESPVCGVTCNAPHTKRACLVVRPNPILAKTILCFRACPSVVLNIPESQPRPLSD